MSDESYIAMLATERDKALFERDEARAERDAFQELACLLERERDEARECCRRLAQEWAEPTGWSGVLPEWVTQ
jgi:hypothetical protein